MSKNFNLDLISKHDDRIHNLSNLRFLRQIMYLRKTPLNFIILNKKKKV